MVKRLISIIAALTLLSSCSNSPVTQSLNNDKTMKEKKFETLSSEERASLILSVKNLNITYDAFDEVYIIDGRPKERCPGHTVWIKLKISADGLASAEFFLLTQDPITNNIGNPGRLLVKQEGQIYSYLVEDPLGIDNIPCGGYEWAYQSRQAIPPAQEKVDNWLNHFADASTKYRLEDERLEGEFRDINLSSEQREINLTILRILNAVWLSQISLKELFGASKYKAGTH
jgi:hypothetical protein